MRRLVVFFCLALALAPAEAQGDAPVAWQRKALAQAGRTWRPPCGPLLIQFAPADPFGLDGHAAGWAYNGDCTIYLRDDKRWLGYPELCDVVLHEAGHVTGHGHASRGIMRPIGIYTLEIGIFPSGRRVVKWGGVDRRCIRPMDRIWRYVQRDELL